jgi:hypothetical protein
MKTAILLDFDDTIFDLRNFRTIHQDEFWKKELSAKTYDKILTEMAMYRKKAGVFAPNRHMSAAEWRKHKNHTARAAPGFMHADAAKFLQILDQKIFTPIIFTFGDAEFQDAKIAPLKLNMPVVYIDAKDKSEYILTWWRDTHYEINGEKYADIVFIDDRVHNFQSFHKLPNARGFLLDRMNENTDDVPNKVIVVRDFTEILRKL